MSGHNPHELRYNNNNNKKKKTREEEEEEEEDNNNKGDSLFNWGLRRITSGCFDYLFVSAEEEENKVTLRPLETGESLT